MLELQLTQGDLKLGEHGNNDPGYEIVSLVFRDDDSVRVIERKTGKKFWATREYKDGGYTGNFELEDGTLITPNVQKQGIEKKLLAKEFVLGGKETQGSFYFSDDFLSIFLKELSSNGYSIKHICPVYQPSDAYSKEHSKESDGWIFSGAEDGSLFGIKLFQNNYYLVDLTVEGGKNKYADGHKTRFYRDNFSLELKNKISGEWSLRQTGVYRDDGYETSWTEVHVKIEAEEDKTIKTLEEIIRKTVVPSKFTCKCVGEV